MRRPSAASRRAFSVLALALPAAFAFGACSSDDQQTASSGHGGSSASGVGGSTGGGGQAGGKGGAGGSGGSGGAAGAEPNLYPPSWDRQVTPPSDTDAATQRAACAYRAGSLPAETQGKSHPNGADIPIKHLFIMMQENRSFDHYFQMLPAYGQTDVEVAPASYANPDSMGNMVTPYHDDKYCLVDPNHEWNGTHEEYDDGKMDGFFLANDQYGPPPPHPLADSLSGARALAYYDQTDLPFYYFLANEFSIADHYHAPLLGPTFPNRQFFYAGTSRGNVASDLPDFADRAGACETDKDCGGATGSCVSGGCKGTCKTDDDCGHDAPIGTCDVASGGVCAAIPRTLPDYLELRHVNWKIYASGTAGFAVCVTRWLAVGMQRQVPIDDFFTDAKNGTLPDFAFIDPHLANEKYNQDDEHSPASPQVGQLLVAQVVQALAESPEWSSSALFITYDEHGGFWDHVPPPDACEPDDIPPEIGPNDAQGSFDRYGVRVPMMLVSPFAKKHFVAHDTYDHTSLTRFVEARFVVPALTNRDANAEAPWEMFDFDAPPHAKPPTITLPTVDQSKLDACAAVYNP